MDLVNTLSSISRMFRSFNGTPFAGYKVLVTELGSNTPIRIYTATGLLLDDAGVTYTDSTGAIEVYAADGREYSISLIGPSGEIIEKSSYDESSILQRQYSVDGEPNGFLDASQVVLSWSNATRTLTISPVGQSFSFYSSGALYTKVAAESIQIPNTSGFKFIHYDEDGRLTSQDAFDPSVISNHALVCSLYWSATDGVAVPDALIELHSYKMPSDVHSYLHATRGTAFQSGLLAAANATGNGDSLLDIQCSVAPGVIYDEDLIHAIPAKLLADNIPVCYRLGSGEWHVDKSSSAIVRTTGSGRAAYNLFSGGVWSLAEVSNGNYCLAHLYAVPGLTEKFMIVMGKGIYLTQASSRAAARSEVLGITGLPVIEAKLIATFLVQTQDNYLNAFKSRIVQTDLATNEAFVDWRYVSTVAGIPSSTPPGGG